MGSNNGPGGHMMAFKVKPQAPANNETIPQVQRVFRGPHSNQLNVRFKQSAPDTSNTARGPVKKGLRQVIQFASNKTTIAFTERKDRPETPPTKKRKIAKYPRTDTEPSLTTRRPISTYVPIDAWALIFKRCNPRFLIQARLVCRDFREILTKQSIWREARRNAYDDSIPDCPSDLSEFQYANLLVGRGCQIKPCTQRLTRKVYWAFMLRMCEQCFNERVRLPEMESEEAKLYAEFHGQLEPEVKQTIPIQLAGLLPAGSMWAGRFSQIRALDRDHQMWRFQDEPQVNYCIIADDYENLRSDFRRKVMSEPSYFLFWARLHWSHTKERIKIAKRLDAAGYEYLDRSLPPRDDKVKFFQEMALRLDPPMTSLVLEKMAAYLKAIETPNAGSLRSWDLLATKIDDPELRDQAEQLVRWDQDDSSWRMSTKDSLYDRLARRRGKMAFFDSTLFQPQNCSPEQRFVLNIAEEELNNLLDIVHDEDVLLMLLNNCRHAYDARYPKPHGLNGDGTEGEYRLLLDDARMIITEVLNPLAVMRGPVRAKKLTSSLRCIGCTRTDCHKTYNFETLMIHVRKVHADKVGRNLYFYKMAVPNQSRSRRSPDPVAWYHIPWPKTFPALPRHRRATPNMIWNPDVEEEYIQHKVENEVNIFASVQPCQNNNIGSDDFTSNFCYAIKTLLDTRLDSVCIIKIALEYASRRLWQSNVSGKYKLLLSISQILQLEAAVKVFTPKVEFKFRCGRCIKDPTSSVRGRQPRETLHPQPLNILAPHWEYNKHRFETDDLLEDLIALPSDYELHQALVKEDAKLSAQKRRALLANKKVGTSNEDEGLGKKDPRAVALLEIPSAQSQFDLLFVPQDEEYDGQSPEGISSDTDATDGTSFEQRDSQPSAVIEPRYFQHMYEESHLPEEELVNDPVW